MPAGDVAECQGGPERDAGPRIIPVHDRPHVVAAGVKSGDHGAILSQDSHMAIRSKTDRRAEFRWIDPERAKWRLLDRPYPPVGPMPGIAELTLLYRVARPQFRSEPRPR